MGSKRDKLPKGTDVKNARLDRLEGAVKELGQAAINQAKIIAALIKKVYPNATPKEQIAIQEAALKNSSVIDSRSVNGPEQAPGQVSNGGDVPISDSGASAGG